jgi:hypothetical protein
VIACACEESLMVWRKRGEVAMFPGPRPALTSAAESCSCLSAISFTHHVHVGPNTLYSTVHDIYGAIFKYSGTSLPWRKIDLRTVVRTRFHAFSRPQSKTRNLGSLLAWHLMEFSNFDGHVPKSLFTRSTEYDPCPSMGCAAYTHLCPIRVCRLLTAPVRS